MKRTLSITQRGLGTFEMDIYPLNGKLIVNGIDHGVGFIDEYNNAREIRTDYPFLEKKTSLKGEKQ